VLWWVEKELQETGLPRSLLGVKNTGDEAEKTKSHDLNGRNF